MIERGFVSIAEGQVHYRTAGKRVDDSALVLLHASPSSSQSLEPLITELAKTHFVIAPDTLGNGDSPAPNVDAPDVAYYADAMDRVSQALGLSSVNVYGTHTGAHIAIEWAIRNPKRVEKLIIEGLAHFTDELRQEFLEHYAPPQSPDESGAQFHWAWQFIRDQMIFFPYYKKDAEHLRTGGTFNAAVLHGLVLDVLNSLETYHLPYQAVFQHDLNARLPLVKVPALCLGNEQTHLDAGMLLALDTITNVTKMTTSEQLSQSDAIAMFIA